MDLAVDDLIQENCYIAISEIVSSAHTMFYNVLDPKETFKE
jgi:hypothetical protein